MILERCRQLADELEVNLKAIEWKEDVTDDRNAYTLIIQVESGSDEVQLANSELEAYCAGTTTTGTDAKLKSIVKKRY